MAINEEGTTTHTNNARKRVESEGKQVRKNPSGRACFADDFANTGDAEVIRVLDP
jgi:hypothetical protein